MAEKENTLWRLIKELLPQGQLFLTRKVKLLPRRKTNLLSIILKTDGLSTTLWKFFFANKRNADVFKA